MNAHPSPVPSGLARVGGRILDIIFKVPTDSFLFFAYLVSVLWGLFVVFFQDFSRPVYAAFRDSFAVLAEFGVPANVTVGAAVFALGAVGLCGVLAVKSQRWQWRTAAAAAFAWASVAWGFGVVDWRLTSTPVYGTLALFLSLSALRLFVEAELERRGSVSTLAEGRSRYVPCAGCPDGLRREGGDAG